MPVRFRICKQCGLDSEKIGFGRITHLRIKHGFKGKSYNGIIRVYYKLSKEVESKV